MEVGPRPANQEVEAQPDLLEEMSDTEVTIFGITGSLKDLAAMCPVDLSDERVSLQAKNEFVVKAANEAGLKIESKYEPLFAHIIEQQGLERKFTVAENKVPAVTDEPMVAKSEPAKAVLVDPLARRTQEPVRKVQAAPQLPYQPSWKTGLVEPAVEMSATEQTKEPVTARAKETIFSELEQSAVTAIETEPASPLRRNTEHSSSAAELFELEKPVISVGPELELVLPRSEPILTRQNKQAASSAVSSKDKPGPVTRKADYRPAKVSPLAPAHRSAKPMATSFGLDQSEQLERTYDLAETAELIFEPEPKSAPERLISRRESVEQTVAADLAQKWTIELAKEPDILYDEFTAALVVFAELLYSDADAEEDNSETEEAGSLNVDQLTESKDVSLILTKVSEAMAGSNEDDKETVAPIIKNIIGAIHGIRLLEARGAEPNDLAQAESQLEELCIELFEAIGVSYDEQTLEKFISFLLLAEFNLKPTAGDLANLPNLELAGTREAKSSLASLTVKGASGISRSMLAILMAGIKIKEVAIQ
jgi:hypothetical protein